MEFKLPTRPWGFSVETLHSCNNLERRSGYRDARPRSKGQQMATEKQLKANRANSQFSTGPKTAIGKAKARNNAWKHGLTATSLTIGDEKPAEFSEVRAKLEDQFRPATAMEHLLLDRVAGLLWRLRRVPGLEAAVINHYLDRQREEQQEALAAFQEAGEEESDTEDFEEPKLDIGEALIADAFHRDMLTKLTRYEASLMSSLTKALQLLHAFQSQPESKLVQSATIEAVAE
jgi:hypothetical protein